MNLTENIECEATGNTPTKKENLLSNDTTKIVGIYGLQNKLKPDKWYIGFSRNIPKRWFKAYKRCGCFGQPKIFNAIAKYGYDGFNKVVLENCSIDTWKERENYWINFYNSINNGYNCIEGGIGRIEKSKLHKKVNLLRPLKRKGIMKERIKSKAERLKSGWGWSEERRQKLSDKMKIKWSLGVYKRGIDYMSEEAKKKLSIERTGKPMNFSEKAISAIRESGRKSKGRKHSPATIEKLKENYKKRINDLYCNTFQPKEI